MAAIITRRRITADEYHRMGETGILRPDERIELIDGEIVESLRCRLLARLTCRAWRF